MFSNKKGMATSNPTPRITRIQLETELTCTGQGQFIPKISQGKTPGKNVAPF